MPFNTTRGAGSAKGYGLTAAVKRKIFFTSRATANTEGETSNFASVTVSSGLTWGYNGGNTDAITITTSGLTAGLLGFSINNRQSGATPHSGVLYVISGSTTGGTILASKAFSVLLPLNNRQTIIEFDHPVLLPPGVYTCAMAWPSAISATRTFRFNTTSRNISSISTQRGTLNVSYSTVSAFNGPGPLGASNGTSHGSSGAGQIVTFKWLI